MDFGRLLVDPIMQHAVGPNLFACSNFLSVFKTREGKWIGRLLADPIMQDTVRMNSLTTMLTIRRSFDVMDVPFVDVDVDANVDIDVDVVDFDVASKHFPIPAEPS